MLNVSLNFLYHMLRSHVKCIYYSCGEVVIEVPHNKVNQVISFLKDHENCLYKLLIDIVVTDTPENVNRFLVIYSLCSVKYKNRVKVITQIDEVTPIKSITNIYKAANWMEREIWDMYGIFFDSHPDLRRILTDYGFEGYPLRKDFPLSGFKELRYSESQKRVIFESIELSQEFRVYTFNSPWESKNLKIEK